MPRTIESDDEIPSMSTSNRSTFNEDGGFVELLVGGVGGGGSGGGGEGAREEGEEGGGGAAGEAGGGSGGCGPEDARHGVQQHDAKLGLCM